MKSRAGRSAVRSILVRRLQDERQYRTMFVQAAILFYVALAGLVLRQYIFCPHELAIAGGASVF
jgi:hypothetical protein